MNAPEVTVLMPVYNGEKFIREAIESVLAQNYNDFEFLIINDGSTDNTLELIQSFKDERIRLIHNDRNIGLIKTLNRGIDLAMGKYIVRMDSDDICLPTRLRKQVSFMESNPEVGISGSWFQIYNTKKIIKHPIDHESIKVALFQYCALGHPTVIMRKDLLLKFDLNYNEEYLHAEDYDLWSRCIHLFPLANLPEVLLYYRNHEEQVSNKFKSIKERTVSMIHLRQINSIGIKPSAEELEIHMKIMEFNYDISVQKGVTIWLENLKQHNMKYKVYKENIFSEFLASLWIPYILIYTKYNKNTWKAFTNSTLYPYTNISFWSRVKFYAKCVIGKK
jgi:glycosyltransferase involved in cell wall biosynthesis